MANITDLHEKEEETKSDGIAVDIKLSKVDDSNEKGGGGAAAQSATLGYDPNQKHSKMFVQPTHPSQRSILLLYIKDRENQTICVLAQQIEILEESILELKSSFAYRQGGLNDDAFNSHDEEVEALRNKVTSLVANLSRVVESSISDRLAGQSDVIINQFIKQHQGFG